MGKLAGLLNQQSVPDSKIMAQQSLEKTKIQFLLFEGVRPFARATLQQSGYSNIEGHKKMLPLEELKVAIVNAHFMGIRSRTQLTQKVFDAAEKLVAVGSLANVAAQCRQIKDKVGYAVMDIDAEYRDIALKELGTIDGTIRSRVLS